MSQDLFEEFDPEELVEMLEEMDSIDPDDRDYFWENYDDLQEDYAGQQVAIVNQTPVAAVEPSAPDEEIRDFLDAAYAEADEGVQPFIWYMEDPDDSFSVYEDELGGDLRV